MPKPRLPGQDPERTTGGVTGGDAKRRLEEARELLEGIDDSDLRPEEEDFVSDMRERLEKYGDHTMVSPKQIFWLRDIVDRQT